MVLDSQSLLHLEIIEGPDGKKDGSLFNYLDNCKTPFGKRQLKRWLMAPLMNIEKLNDRLDAVEDLMKYNYQLEQCRVELAKLPDLEKLLARIFSYSVKHRIQAIYFEDVSLSKMKEFRQLLRSLRTIPDTLNVLRKLCVDFNSKRLKQLLIDDTQNGMYPSSLLSEIDQFDKLIVWKKLKGCDIEMPEP